MLQCNMINTLIMYHAHDTWQQKFQWQLSFNGKKREILAVILLNQNKDRLKYNAKAGLPKFSKMIYYLFTLN